MIDQADCRKSPPMTTATTRSGQAALVQKTKPAATTTARLPKASLREKSQTARTLASPFRCGIRINAAATFATSATAPKAFGFGLTTSVSTRLDKQDDKASVLFEPAIRYFLGERSSLELYTGIDKPFNAFEKVTIPKTILTYSQIGRAHV